MKYLIVITLVACTMFPLCADAGEALAPQKAEPRVVKKYHIGSIYFDKEDRKLYAFGYINTDYLDEDRISTIEEPKILRISEDGRYETEINAAFFGLEHYGKEEHAHDGQTTQTWFVDSAYGRILRFKGNPQSAANQFSSLLTRGPTPESFFTDSKMPIYGFQVSIAGSPQRIWVAPSVGGRHILARDEKNGLLWEDIDGTLKISSDATHQTVSYKPHDYISRIFPDERDGTAWLYLSHNRGELLHLDRNGNTLNKVPIAKYLTSEGSVNKIAIDFEHEQIWYADTGYPFKLVQLSLSGERKFEMNFQQITGATLGSCFNASLTLQEDGALWFYCAHFGIFKLDSSGKRLLKVEVPDPLQN